MRALRLITLLITLSKSTFLVRLAPDPPGPLDIDHPCTPLRATATAVSHDRRYQRSWVSLQ